MGPCHSAQVPAISVSIPTFFSPPSSQNTLKIPRQMGDNNAQHRKFQGPLQARPRTLIQGSLVWNPGLELWFGAFVIQFWTFEEKQKKGKES